MNKDKNNKIKEALKATKAKRVNQSCKVFELKIQTNKMNKKQYKAINHLFVEAKWLYNAILVWSQLDRKIYEYPTKNKTVFHKNKNNELIETEFEYLGSQMKQSIVDRMMSSIKTLASLKKKGIKVGKLKFKKNMTMIDLKQNIITYKIKGNKIKIQGLPGWYKINGSQQLNGYELANAKLLNTAKGFYLKVTCFKNKEQEQNKENKKDIGVDLGCSTAVTLSDGRKFKARIEETDRLKRLQKKLARQTKRSNNYRKTLKLINVEHQKITCRKNDLANKIVHQIKQDSNIYMQDEMLSNWQKNGHGKAIQYGVLGRVKMKLKQVAVKVLPKEIPTTKLCYNCGKKNNISLSQRIYECDCTINPEDRDIHSAKNMILISKGLVPNYSLPVERREIKRVESKTTTQKEISKQVLDVESRSCLVFS